MTKEKLVVSACLLGRCCKYNGGHNHVPGIEALFDRYEVIEICPEAMGGLKAPRVPSERVGDKVLSRDGKDLTAAFQKGAETALQKAGNARLALLKERSPSCGCGTIYDGTFTGTVVEGNGVAAELFLRNGFTIYGESDLAKLLT